MWMLIKYMQLKTNILIMVACFMPHHLRKVSNVKQSARNLRRIFYSAKCFLIIFPAMQNKQSGGGKDCRCFFCRICDPGGTFGCKVTLFFSDTLQKCRHTDVFHPLRVFPMKTIARYSGQYPGKTYRRRMNGESG